MSVRAVAHVHSDWSYDGRWTLETLARAFGRRGYGAVLLTEHDAGFDEGRWRDYRAACAAAGRDVVLVPGIEYSDPDNGVHVSVWGADAFLGEGRGTAELLAAAADAGAPSVLMHPWRRDAWRALELPEAATLVGVEIWSRKYDGWAPNPRAPALLRSHPGLVPFVGLDFHTARQFFPLAMVLDLDGPPSVEGVLDALRARRCAAQAFRLPVGSVVDGLPYALLRGAEGLRRPLARTARRAARAARRRGR